MTRRGPPTDPDPAPGVSSVRRFSRSDTAIYAALTTLHVVVVSWVAFLLFTNLDGKLRRVVMVVVITSLVIDLLFWELRWISLPLMRVPVPRPARDGWRVAAVITFVPGTESIDMLEQTLAAVTRVRYPHDTWVLDEGAEATVRRLSDTYGARYFTRHGRPEYQQPTGSFRARTKYGNLNAWMQEHGATGYDLVTVFDSDHIPRPEYYDRVLGYFDDPRIAYVQPAQAYYNQGASFIAAAAAEETYAYYSSLQMIGFGMGYPIIVGCHNTHRVSAITDIGGFPAHEADDLVMTLQYRSAGWRGVYVPEILARGLTPADWRSYLTQQRRWARSVLDCKLRVFPTLASRLPTAERLLQYVHGLYYLRGPLVAVQLALLAVALLLGVTPVVPGVGVLQSVAVLLFSIMACDFFRQRFFLDPGTEQGIHWRSRFVEIVKWPAFLMATVDVARNAYGTYTTTPKSTHADRATRFALVHGVVFVALGGAWIVDLQRGPSAFIPLHLAIVTLLSASLAALWTALRPAPPAWDPALRQRWNEVTPSARNRPALPGQERADRDRAGPAT